MASSSNGRLLTDDANHHSAWLWITSVIGIVLVSCSAVYRVMQRWKIWSWDSFDDHLAALTYVFAVIHFSILLAAAGVGLGEIDTHKTETSILEAAKYTFASRILCAATVCASQCSVLMTLKRIVQVWRDRWLPLLATGFASLCFIVVLLTLTIDCPSQSGVSGIGNDTCSSPEPRLVVIAALEAVNEVLPLGLAIYFMWKVQITSQQRRYAIIGYIVRISNVILIALSALYSVKALRTGRSSFDIIKALVIQDLLVISEFLSVVAIYFARAMNDFQTAGPAITLSGAKEYSSKGDTSEHTAIRLKSLRGDTEGVRNKITHVEKTDGDSESSQMGIIRTVQFEVTADRGSGPTEAHDSHYSEDPSMRRRQADSIEVVAESP